MPSDKPSLEELQRLKLSLEIEKLKTPWWKRPSVWAATLPILLALGTLVTAYWTGLFDTQSKLLEIRETELRINVNDLDDQREELKLEKTELENERIRIEAELAQLRRNLATEPFFNRLRQLQEQPGDRYRLASGIIEILKQQGEFQDYYVEALEGIIADAKSGPTIRGIMSYVLYQGTGEDRWWTQLLETYQTEVHRFATEAGPYPKLLHVLEFFPWYVDEKNDLALILGKALKSYNLDLRCRRVIVSNLASFYQFTETSSLLQNKPRVCLDIIESAIEIVHKTASSEYPHSAMGVLESFAPAAHVIYSAQLLAGDMPLYAEARVRCLHEVLRVSERFGIVGCPAADTKELWSAWLSRRRKSVELWTEADLRSFRTDPGLLMANLKSLS